MVSSLAFKRLVRVVHVPVFVALGAGVIGLPSQGAHPALLFTIVAAIGVSFAAERTAPYDPTGTEATTTVPATSPTP